MNIPGLFFFAPLAEISSVPLRRCVRSFSRDTVLFSEMLSAHMILYGGKNNRYMIQRSHGDDPFIYQILGSDPAMMAEASAFLETLSPCGIDINMGCSAPEILSSGVGAALLRDEAAARAIVRSCRAAVKGSLSVKIRAGFDAVDKDFTLRFCRMIEDEGADWVVVHPRAAKLAFRRSADWNVIRHIHENIRIPVIGNGDIHDASNAAGRISGGWCDGVMIARQAVQEPWIFASCEKVATPGSANVTVDLFDVASSVLNGIRDGLPPETHRSRAHRFLFYYCKNFIFGHELFSRIRNTEDVGEMEGFLRGYCERNPGERFRVL